MCKQQSYRIFIRFQRMNENRYNNIIIQYNNIMYQQPSEMQTVIVINSHSRIQSYSSREQIYSSGGIRIQLYNRLEFNRTSDQNSIVQPIRIQSYNRLEFNRTTDQNSIVRPTPNSIVQPISTVGYSTAQNLVLLFSPHFVNLK